MKLGGPKGQAKETAARRRRWQGPGKSEAERHRQYLGGHGKRRNLAPFGKARGKRRTGGERGAASKGGPGLTCILFMASRSWSSWCAELSASRRMSVSFISLSLSSFRSCMTVSASLSMHSEMLGGEALLRRTAQSSRRPASLATSLCRRVPRQVCGPVTLSEQPASASRDANAKAPEIQTVLLLYALCSALAIRVALACPSAKFQ